MYLCSSVLHVNFVSQCYFIVFIRLFHKIVLVIFLKVFPVICLKGVTTFLYLIHANLSIALLYFTFLSFISAKIRRLYDIANVLSSLKLIKKVHVTEERGRKPAFKWTGPEVLPNTQGRWMCHFL